VILSRRGVGDALGREIEERTGFETRVTVLGHVQRGGSPTTRDRVLATRFGLKAADLALSGEFGQMAALRGDDVIAVPLAEATAQLKVVPREWQHVARSWPAAAGQTSGGARRRAATRRPHGRSRRPRLRAWLVHRLGRYGEVGDAKLPAGTAARARAPPEALPSSAATEEEDPGSAT
jgi:hypothetical protein